VTLPANFGRAVDLSGLGKPAPAKAAVNAGLVVTATNLTAEILPLSRTKLVVLLCWSNRSPESIKVLEILAKLQSDDGDLWSLGTVDIDSQPQVAQALQVRTVPYALALIAEQVVPLFEQIYPEAQIRQVIDKVLSIAAEQGIGSAPVEVIEPEEEEAMAALEAGDFLAAEVAYKKWLARKPQEVFAKLGLAQTQLLIRTSGLDATAIHVAAEAAPNDVSIQIQCADCEIIAGKVESAFNRLLTCIKLNSGEDQNRAKNHLLDLFTLVDPGDPRLIKARSALANALF
jgi:putative thioredoxin